MIQQSSKLDTIRSSQQEEKEEDSCVKIYGNTTLKERLSVFEHKLKEHEGKQKINPFSGTYQSSSHSSLKVNDPNYGRPIVGSKTELRGKAAASHIGNEVKELITIIKEFGQLGSGGYMEITFKELFNIYVVISNKLVGILLRARRQGLLHFEGEMLYQRKDDHVIITLLQQL